SFSEEGVLRLRGCAVPAWGSAGDCSSERRPPNFPLVQSVCQPLLSSCRSNVRSSSFCKVESSALIGHGGNRRGTVDVSKRARPTEGPAHNRSQGAACLRSDSRPHSSPHALRLFPIIELGHLL